jgi:carbon-monoxide dehydrogenase medium subunit
MSDDTQTLRIAIGSVEATPRRWFELEQVLTGAPPDSAQAEQMAKAHLQTITGRDAVDAKGSYRVRVLPSLIGRAMAKLETDRREVA